jgi:hypothetical protein
MATGTEVLEMIIPTGGWVIYGDDFDSIRYDEGVVPVTKSAFDAGFTQYDAYKAAKDAEHETAKADLFARLGITAEEATLLLG